MTYISIHDPVTRYYLRKARSVEVEEFPLQEDNIQGWEIKLEYKINLSGRIIMEYQSHEISGVSKRMI